MRRMLLATALIMPAAAWAACPDDAAVARLAAAATSGQPVPSLQGLPLADAEFAARLGSMTVTFIGDDRELVRVPASVLLGHPLNALAWLAGGLARSGWGLQAGDIVSLGGFAPSVPARAGHVHVQRYEGLAPQPVGVEVRVQ